jgi:hypothetical protein
MIEGWGLAIGAGVAAAGTIAGSVIQGNAAQSAAQDQENASENATQAQLSMFNTTEANTASQRALGQGSSNLLANVYGIPGVANANGTTSTGGTSPNYSAFYQNPGYQFQLQQGQAAINKQAAANGNLYSSGTLAAQGNYAQGVASQGYQSYIQNLMQMAGLGNAANSTSATAATATGQGVANSMTNAGNAAANGALGQSNAFANGLGSITNNSMLSNYLTNPNAGGAYGGEFAPGVSTGVTFDASDPFNGAFG